LCHNPSEASAQVGAGIRLRHKIMRPAKLFDKTSRRLRV
jgi:hypothetical protein